MGTHHASVFLYREYQADVRALVEQTDKRNYGPLRNRTCEAVRQLQQEWPRSDLGLTRYEGGVPKEVLTQEWPLLNHGGGGLPSEADIKNLMAPRPRDLGYWFLIILAEYLRPSPSPLGNWTVIEVALAKVGWRQRERDLLFKGQPTSTLLKPRIGTESPWPLKDSDPYWFWLHPEQARSGWLELKDISRLYGQLQKTERKLKAFDVCQIPNIDADNPIVVRDYQRYLQEGYRGTLTMLSAALAADQGLFVSLTLP